MARTPCQLARKEHDIKHPHDTQLHTSEGVEQIDTDESLFDWVAALLIGTLFFFDLLAAVGAVIAAFYIFLG